MSEENSKPQSGSIPLRTTIVCAYIFKKGPDGPRFLVLKRHSRYMFGLWQQVAGAIEEGETAIEAILRELKEETGHSPMALYSADMVESFYNPGRNCIMIVPVFVAEFDPAIEVIISGEHSEYKWAELEQAKEYFTFPQQKLSLDIISREFVEKEPPAHLRIEF